MNNTAPAQLIRNNTPTEPGTYYRMIATGGACDVRRAEVRCGCCGKDVGLNTALVLTASGRPSHAECYERLDIANLPPIPERRFVPQAERPLRPARTPRAR